MLEFRAAAFWIDLVRGLSATSGNSTLPICSRWNVCFTSPSRRSKLTTEAGAIHVFEVGEG